MLAPFFGRYAGKHDYDKDFEPQMELAFDGVVREAAVTARDVGRAPAYAVDRQMGRDAALCRTRGVTGVRRNHEAVAQLERHDVIIGVEGPRLGPRELDDEGVA